MTPPRTIPPGERREILAGIRSDLARGGQHAIATAVRAAPLLCELVERMEVMLSLKDQANALAETTKPERDALRVAINHGAIPPAHREALKSLYERLAAAKFMAAATGGKPTAMTVGQACALGATRFSYWTAFDAAPSGTITVTVTRGEVDYEVNGRTWMPDAADYAIVAFDVVLP